MVGKGNDMTFNPSIEIMDCQKSTYVSEFTLLWRMEKLVKHLVRWDIHSD